MIKTRFNWSTRLKAALFEVSRIARHEGLSRPWLHQAADFADIIAKSVPPEMEFSLEVPPEVVLVSMTESLRAQGHAELAEQITRLTRTLNAHEPQQVVGTLGLTGDPNNLVKMAEQIAIRATELQKG